MKPKAKLSNAAAKAGSIATDESKRHGIILSLATFAVLYLGIGFQLTLQSIMINPVSKMYSVNIWQSALALSIFHVAFAITYWVAPLTARIGVRRVVILSGFLVTFGRVAITICPYIVFVYPASICAGVGTIFLHYNAIILLNEHYKYSENLSVAMGFALCGQPVAIMTTPFILYWLQKQLGWTIACTLCGGLSFFLVLIALCLKPETKTFQASDLSSLSTVQRRRSPLQPSNTKIDSESSQFMHKMTTVTVTEVDEKGRPVTGLHFETDSEKFPEVSRKISIAAGKVETGLIPSISPGGHFLEIRNKTPTALTPMLSKQETIPEVDEEDYSSDCLEHGDSNSQSNSDEQNMKSLESLSNGDASSKQFNVEIHAEESLSSPALQDALDDNIFENKEVEFLEDSQDPQEDISENKELVQTTFKAGILRKTSEKKSNRKDSRSKSIGSCPNYHDLFQQSRGHHSDYSSSSSVKETSSRHKNSSSHSLKNSMEGLSKHKKVVQNGHISITPTDSIDQNKLCVMNSDLALCRSRSYEDSFSEDERGQPGLLTVPNNKVKRVRSADDVQARMNSFQKNKSPRNSKKNMPNMQNRRGTLAFVIKSSVLTAGRRETLANIATKPFQSNRRDSVRAFSGVTVPEILVAATFRGMWIKAASLSEIQAQKLEWLRQKTQKKERIAALKNPRIWIYGLITLLLRAAFAMILVYIPTKQLIVIDRATHFGVFSTMFCLGLGALTGRILLGMVADWEQCDRVYLNFICCLVAGLISIARGSLQLDKDDAILQRVLSLSVAFLSATSFLLYSVHVIEIIPGNQQEHVTFILRIMDSFQAAGYVIGPVVAGIFFTYFQEEDHWILSLTGIFLLIGAFLLVLVSKLLPPATPVMQEMDTGSDISDPDL